MKKNLLLLTLVLTTLLSKAQTWNQDIAPIFYTHCGKCHHEGGIAPMSLVTYDEASSETNDIEDAIQNDEMPPWPANHNYTNFIGENVLTEEEKQAIFSWIDNGAPEGSGSAPTIPAYNDGYAITSPDEIVTIPEYNVAFNTDEYRTFTIPSTSAQDRYIGGVEFEPDNDDIVHHILAFYDPSNVSQQLDDAAAGPGFPSNGGSFPSDEAVLIGVWVPGMTATIFPEDLAILLPGGSDFVFEVHYAPGSLGDQADVHMRLQYKDIPVIREVYHDPLLFHGPPSLMEPLFIPANTVQTFHEVSAQTPIDLSFISVFPHMHLLGQTFKVYGLTAEEDTVRFIDVDNYEFHWQFSYTFPTLKKLPLGSILHGYATYDNTENNDENPNSPPEDVGLGEGTEDEMMVCFFMYTVYQPGDEEISLVSVKDVLPQESTLLFAYPNPAHDNILIDLPNQLQKVDQILIIDQSGKTLNAEYDFSYGRLDLNTSDLPAALYEIQIVAGQSKYHTRFLKQ